MTIEEKRYGMVDILKLPLKCVPFFGMVVAIQILIMSILPTIQVVITARFIDTALSIVHDKTDVNLIYPQIFAVVALIAYTWISGALGSFAQVRLELAIREELRTAITEKRAKLAYKHIEDHQTWDLISRVSKAPEIEIKTAYIDLLTMISNIIKVLGILILLMAQVWWAALAIMAFSIPLFSLAMKGGRANYQANREVTKYKRKYEYLGEVLTGRESVDERTLFGYGEGLNHLWHSHFEKARRVELATEKKWFIKMKSGSIITAFISILILLVLLNPVLSGGISIGMFISLVNAVFGLVQMMSWDFTYSVDQLAKHREYLKDLTDFSALEETKGATSRPISPPPVFESIELRNVHFKYPDTENPILNGLSLRMESGKHYAFVGVNGAGKTTITKLITGLYDDFQGQILINGKSISEYDQSQLKALFSVAYQDFARYYITFKDNIAVGDMASLDAENTLERILGAIDLVELDHVVEKLPYGQNTPLGKIKEGGQDISGGQWQRLALARTIMSPAPIKILDEPTASLDPIGESRVYEEFEKISRGKTTIFISHRLGSTKLADEIFVIDQGRVIERGPHGELMDFDGVYARMYESQRSWYQSGPNFCGTCIDEKDLSV